MPHLRLLVLAVTAVAVVLTGGASATAHDLRAEVRVKADEVTVEAGYDDDTPAEQARVTVKEATGSTIATGVLDDRGLWSFPRPAPGSYAVTVEVAGHRDRVTFEIPGAAPDAAPAPETTYSRWRLDKRLGLAIGLFGILGGTMLWIYLRRGRPADGQ